MDSPASDVPAAEVSIIDELGLTAESKGASEHTVKVNSALYSMLDFEDTSDAENAVKGLIDAPDVLEVTDESGNVIWSQKAYSFLDDYEEAPETVNPSLCENSKNNHAYGLFEVVEGIYQVRGYDMANLTVIDGETGWIVFDHLMSKELTPGTEAPAEMNTWFPQLNALWVAENCTGTLHNLYVNLRYVY